MARLKAVNQDEVLGRGQELLHVVQSKFGMVPNMTRQMAIAPAVLEGYLSFADALAGGQLNAGLREQIALAVGEANRCQYCVSAHSAIGKMVGLGAEEIASSRQAEGADPKVDAALKFARTIVERRAQVGNADITRVRQAGYTDAQIGEIVAHVALNIFTNYFNNVAQTEVDFPKVELAAAAR